MIIYQRDL